MTQGKRNNLAGLAAEERVAEQYVAQGAVLKHMRWRGTQGEIDLIVEKNATIICIEVKQSRTLDAAAYHLRPPQIARLHQTAQEYLDTLQDGGLRDVRFDVALVDTQGRINILQNALWV